MQLHPYDVVLGPLVSEKTQLGTAENKYVFKVMTKANKIQIRRAIEALYNVRVTDVNTSNFMGKTKGSWRLKGKRSDWKKAIISVHKDDLIQELVEMV